MKYIIAIVGASGAGKTTISLAMQEAKIPIPSVVSYTTRQMRPLETNGIEHIFISEDNADVLLAQYHTAAFTKIAGRRYFTLWHQFDQPIMSYVIDERGLMDITADLRQPSIPGLALDTDYKIISVHVTRDSKEIEQTIDSERIKRDKERASLPESFYRIRIINDASSEQELKAWSKMFAEAIITMLSFSAIKQCELHTSDLTMHNILNAMNGVVAAELVN